MAKFSSFEDEMLVGAYLLADEIGGDFIKLRSITDRFDIEFNPNWLHRLLQSFIDSGYSNDARHIGGDPLDQTIFLTPYGYKRGEELSEHIELSPRKVGPDSAPEGWSIEASQPLTPEVAPAADRIVRFDHNSQSFREIASAIDDMREAVRQSNSPNLDEAERDRVMRGLDAAKILWEASQLRILQIKVGIIMAVEDAAAALKSTAKAVAAALLIDTIKTFVKTHSGIDLDHL